MRYEKVDFDRVYYLTKWLEEVLNEEPKRFRGLTPSSIPSAGGVYFISDLSHDSEEVVYIGLSGNLSKRVYTYHYQGNKTASQIKVALVKHGRARDLKSAKELLKDSYAVRFSVIPDYREREMREGFAKAILRPEFSLYKSKEH